MIKIYRYILLFCLIIVSGCQNKNIDKITEAESYYISFTVNKNENNSLKMYINTYDMENGQIECKNKIPYTAQYPLGVYDKKNNQVYYSSKVHDKYDELFVKDLNTNKKKQLTNSFFAINYIFPINNKLYIRCV